MQTDIILSPKKPIVNNYETHSTHTTPIPDDKEDANQIQSFLDNNNAPNPSLNLPTIEQALIQYDRLFQVLVMDYIQPISKEKENNYDDPSEPYLVVFVLACQLLVSLHNQFDYDSQV